ncbi:hypothetical protein GCM10022254_09150 [Actinomadura meridiana]|uniref:Uncharacterized protein n=1 Tax=Actinomadura meridiana TaxID=559626 RepID=A0ABP8BTP7_9ACTN
MDETIMTEVTDQIIAQLRDSATWDEKQAAELRAGADRMRGEAVQLREQAEEIDVRAGDCDAHAVLFEARGRGKRAHAAQLAGAPVLPTPGEVLPVGGLGMAISTLKMIPRKDPSPEELTSYRDLMRQVHETGLHQLQLAEALLREAQRTVITGQLAPEDMPQPDPLTASPGEESGAHKVPPVLSAPVVEPDADAQCEYCTAPLVRLAGAWTHAATGQQECGPYGDLTACPIGVTYRGEDEDDAATQESVVPAQPKPATALKGIKQVAHGLLRRKPAAEPEEGDPIPYQRLLGQRVIVRRTDGSRSRGVLDIAGRDRLVLHPCEEGPAEIAVADVVGVLPVRARADRPVLVDVPRGEYPSEPVTGPVPVDPQARQVLPSSHGAKDATEAFPPVIENGGVA